MADFTEIDQQVDAALAAAESDLKRSLSDFETSLVLAPHLPALRQFARTLFDTAIDAALADPRLAGEVELKAFLSDHLRPHMIERVLGDSRRARVFEQTREERNRTLRDHRQIRADGDLYIAPLVSGTDNTDLDEDRRDPAPAELQVLYEPFGLWESRVPPNCRFVLRLHAAAAREELSRLFDVLAQRGLARRLASEEQRNTIPEALMAGRVSTLRASAASVGDTGKHDRRLLHAPDGKPLESVTPKQAQKYLAIGDRQRQKLVADRVLTVTGTGHRKRITVPSLLAYAPGDTEEFPK